LEKKKKTQKFFQTVGTEIGFSLRLVFRQEHRFYDEKQILRVIYS